MLICLSLVRLFGFINEQFRESTHNVAGMMRWIPFVNREIRKT
jgi:hypothetical protein